MTPVVRNGSPEWNSLADSIDDLHKKVDEQGRKMAVVETKLDGLHCEAHRAEIGKLWAAIDGLREGMGKLWRALSRVELAVASSAGKWASVSNIAVGLVAIGAILWKVLG